MTKIEKPFGPWAAEEVRTFLSGVVGGHKDSVNYRFDLDTTAQALARKAFDSEDMWTELESLRLNKRSKASYNA